MRNCREIDGTIRWECWACGLEFREECGLDVLSHGECEKRPGRKGDLWGSSGQDWQAAHSARYILDDLNNPEGMKALSELTGYPLGVISAAFANFFPPNA